MIDSLCHFSLFSLFRKFANLLEGPVLRKDRFDLGNWYKKGFYLETINIKAKVKYKI